MIEIEILNACLTSPNSNKYSNGYDSYCILKDSSNKEIDRTDVCYQSFDPAWSKKITKSYHDLSSKEKINNRPFYLESFIVEIYDISQTKEKSDKIKHIKMYETRVPISNVGLFKSYRLLKAYSSSNVDDSSTTLDESRIFMRINRIDNKNATVDDVFNGIDSFTYAELTSLYPTTHPMYRHLYMDFSWSSQAYTYTGGLPGPTKGELVVDIYYHVEWKVSTGSNLFGDKFLVNSIGNLIITDLRVIFIPLEVSSPFWTELLSEEYCNASINNYNPTSAVHNAAYNGIANGFNNNHCYSYTPEQILIAQRYTFQLPLSAIVEIKSYLSSNSSYNNNNNNNNNNNSFTPNLSEHLITTHPPFVLYIESLDCSTVEFLIRKSKPIQTKRGNIIQLDVNQTISSDTADTNAKRRFMSQQSHSGTQKPCTTGESYTNQSSAATNSALYALRCYRYGLETMEVDPQQWCERVLDYIQWEIKLDMIWIRWAKYVKLSCLELNSNKDQSWIQLARKNIDLHEDYQRLRVHDCDWQLSDLNNSYHLCATYPSLLVLPNSLSDEEIKKAATERSINRLPSMVWLQPYSKAPLCRASQPMAGMKGNSIEHDKKMLLAIKSSCLTGLPLRIADARPKLNANANAVQGKGFENISFLGGHLVASISFLDIDNIHVMRSSIQKLRDSGTSNNSNSSGQDGINATVSSGGTGTGSGGSNGWLNHIMAVLKGAVSVADSLMLGHPTLVHCSDGWDRTAQLTSLVQLMLDPYYRTIEGFIVLVYKEWILHGHKFEDRLGRANKKQEVSPVYLQFLDAVYQIQRQFPTHFEFSSQFITLFSQIAYSGYFISFRKNSERERLQLIRGIGAYEDMSAEDFDFSAFSCYVHILLRSSNYCSLLLNPLYKPPSASKKLVHYLRPRYNKHDLELWREGLCGLNNNLLLITSLSPPTITTQEASIMHHDLHQRCMGYLDIHYQHLAPNIQATLTSYKATEYPQYCPNSSIWQSYNPNNISNNYYKTNNIKSFNKNSNSINSKNQKNIQSLSKIHQFNYLETRLLNAIYPTALYLSNPFKLSNICIGLSNYSIDTYLLTSTSNTTGNELTSSIDVNNHYYNLSYYPYLEQQKRVICCIRIQYWYKSIVLADKAAIEYYPSKIIANNNIISKRSYCIIYKTILIIIISYFKSKYRSKEVMKYINERFVLSILDEIIEDAMIQCFRTDIHSKQNEWNLVNSLLDLNMTGNISNSGHQSIDGFSESNSYRRSDSGGGLRSKDNNNSSRDISPIPDGMRSTSSKSPMKTNYSTINNISNSNSNSNNISTSKSFSKRFFGGFSSNNKDNNA